MHIPIDKESIPYRFEIELRAEIFEMEIHYNSEYDFFTLTLYSGEDELLCIEKIVYGKKLFEEFEDSRFPKVDIIPRDDAGNESHVTWDNLNETVFLEVIE